MREARETSVRIVGNLDEIRTRYISSTSLQCYSYFYILDLGHFCRQNAQASVMAKLLTSIRKMSLILLNLLAEVLDFPQFLQEDAGMTL
jgi:hypothetical protein